MALLLLLILLCCSMTASAQTPGGPLVQLDNSVGFMIPRITGNEWFDPQGEDLLPVDRYGMATVISLGLYVGLDPTGRDFSVGIQPGLEIGGSSDMELLTLATPMLVMFKYGADTRPWYDISPGFGAGLGYCFRYLNAHTNRGSTIDGIYGAPILALEASKNTLTGVVLRLRYMQSIGPYILKNHGPHSDSEKFLGDLAFSTPTLNLVFGFVLR